MRTRALLVGVYILLAFGWYGALRLDGAATINWWGVPIWALLVWFLFRGSRVAWFLTLAVTLLGVLTLVGFGFGLALALVGIAAFAGQLTVLLALKPGRIRNAH